MRVNFPAAVALWLHFSSSATVCAARARTIPHRTTPHRTAHPPARARLLASPPSMPHPNRTRPPQREHPPRITLPVVIRLASHSRQQIPSPSATHCHHHCHFAPSAHHRGTPSALTARSALPRMSPRLHPGASERIDRDSADPTIARPGACWPPRAHDFRLSLSDAVYE
ncbi:hypothetical protein X777_07860 [Ooceraea biroi]|uniref:Secreted protein n=1 Tax=Ooceraea biroi TaxID=2015173 RepID=A0A026WZR4_OOCBI|nr:hypothetical protein X777_07860 [Ooceraea biroi]